MTDDQRFVQGHYPNAFDCWHDALEVFKVYHMVGVAWVALSAGKATKAEAWADAVQTIRNRSNTQELLSVVRGD